MLASAREALAKRNYPEAKRVAESLLRARVADSIRAPALLIAADASYAMHAYGEAAVRYAEFGTRYANTADAPRAAMMRGWSELRAGRPEDARRAWLQLDARAANDARAPLALALAAEIGRRTGDIAPDNQLIARYPATPYAGIARLNRAVADLRAHRDEAAVRHLDEAMRAHGPVVIEERRRLADAIAAPTAAPIEMPARPASSAAETTDVIDRAARLVDRRDGEIGGYLLHGLVLLSAANAGWANAGTLSVTDRLATIFPAYPETPPLFRRIGAAAANAGQWHVARRAYEALVARYPNAAPTRDTRADLGEALLRTGASREARGVLEKAAAAGGESGARALLLLAEYHETAGDRRAALAAFERVSRDHPRTRRSSRSLLAHARLLEHFGDAAGARPVLRKALAVAEGEEAAEAAYRLGEGLRGEGQHAAAVEWYMTAAYAAERSRWAHQSLLAAATCLSGLGEKQAALALYLKLVANDGETRGEAAYRAAEIYTATGLRDEALKMYMTSARLTAGSPARSRALADAAKMLMAAGDRAAAEALVPSRGDDSAGGQASAGGPTSRPVKGWIPVTGAPSRNGSAP
jgi:TolA-binding protein